MQDLQKINCKYCKNFTTMVSMENKVVEYVTMCDDCANEHEAEMGLKDDYLKIMHDQQLERIASEQL